MADRDNERPSYPVGIRNGLISPAHRKRIGSALWEFMWLVDHVTEEYETPKGEIRGRVLGGALITAERIAGDFSDPAEGIRVSADTVRNHLVALDRAEYIICRRGTNGFHIEVRNSKKWVTPSFSVPDPSPTSQSEVSKVGDGNCQPIGESENRRFDKNPESPICQLVNSPIASIDIAVERDIAEDNASIASTNQVSCAELWTAAVDAAAGGVTDRVADALRQCQVGRVDENTITVTIPAERELQQRVRLGLVVVRQMLKEVSGRRIELVVHEPRGP